jgi:hypothetical protein
VAGRIALMRSAARDTFGGARRDSCVTVTRVLEQRSLPSAFLSRAASEPDLVVLWERRHGRNPIMRDRAELIR